jgi:uncharacterized protein YbjQ (UPF0145 family)
MKRAIVSVLALAVLVLAGCRTTDLTTNKVGWSYYSDIAVKDYDVLGIIKVESEEVYHKGPLGFTKSLKGSRIVWSDLMAEAAKLDADDVINIRIETTDQNYRRWWLVEFFAGYTLTYHYKAVGLAIKYTDAIERVESNRGTELLQRSSGPQQQFIEDTEKNSLFGLFYW